MFVGITNTPRDYAWGSAGEISSLLGIEPTGKPEAELWLGAHPGSPSLILHPEQAEGATDLLSLIDHGTAHLLGAGVAKLPFLLKVLAAGAPLSLQAHPTTAQAEAGFAGENARGIALESPTRNFRDQHAKPEIIYALSDTFDALCGFRSLDNTRALFTTLGLAGLVPLMTALLIVERPHVDVAEAGRDRPHFRRDPGRQRLFQVVQPLRHLALHQHHDGPPEARRLQ